MRSDRKEALMKRFSEEPCIKAAHMSLRKLECCVCEVDMIVDKKMSVLEGFANGGFIETLGNTAGVYAAMTTVPAGHTRKIDSNIHHTNVARVGEWLVATAYVKTDSNSLVWIEFDINNKTTDKLVAFGTAVYNKPPSKSTE